MKNILFITSLLLSFLSASAQESYTIKMQVRMEGLPPEYAAYGDQEITTYIKGKKSKTELSSAMYSSIIYFDGEKITTLNDMMGNKSGYTATKSEMEAMDKSDKKDQPKIEYTKEKKMIAGYECTKAIITSAGKDGVPTSIVAWVTEKIKTDKVHNSASNRNTNLGDLKGQPLEMEMSHSSQGQDVKVIMTTTEISTDAVPDSTFVANTEGYQMSTFKEWQEQMKAMGAGN